MTDPLHFKHLIPPFLVCGLIDHSESDCPSKNALFNDSVLLESKHSLVNSPFKDDLIARFQERSIPESIWQPLAIKASRRQLSHFLHINFAGRSIRLPAIKHTTAFSESIPQELYPDGSDASILSPRNPKSCLYPNGVFTTQWLEKYNYIVPGNIAIFYNLTPNAESDDELSHEILKFKLETDARNIKLSVILVENEDSTEHERLVQDRIYNLRSSTGLQSRTGLFLLQRNSTVKEREALVESLCQQAYSKSLEFYTVIAKNIRRKRGKRHVLSSSQVSDDFKKLPLSSAGWQARYDYKLSILSELRQDLQFSLGCYETAYDSILELFETLSPLEESGKEPWIQARALLDSIAFKIIRCCLYEHQGTTAFRKFDVHICSVSAIIEQKGISRESYQYVNWLANQYNLLAELLKLSGNELVPKHSSLAPGMDSSAPNTRLPRSGFLYLEAAELIQGLDNLPRSEDPYMNNEMDFGKKLEDLLSNAIEDFSLESNVEQSRSVNYSYYQLGETFYNQKEYERALKYFKKAAEIYRKEKWERLLTPVIEKIEECSKQINSIDDLYYSEIEKVLLSTEKIDISKIKRHGDEFKTLKPNNLEVFNYGFAFELDQCYRTTDTYSQLSIQPINPMIKIQLSQLILEFEGCSNVVVDHEDTELSTFVEIKDDNKANLTFENGNQRIFQFRHHPEQLGEVRLKSVAGILKTDAFECTIHIDNELANYSYRPVPWYNGAKIRHLTRKSPTITEVLPRPSRVKISHDLEGAVALGENVAINFQVANMETEDINLTLDAAIKSSGKDHLELSWDKDIKDIRMTRDETKTFELIFQIPHTLATTHPLTLELTSSYEAVSEPGMVIKDAISQSIVISRLFRIDFGMSPLVHPDSWPNLFVPNEEFSQIPKIVKRWDLNARILFVGDAKVDILDAVLDVKSDETTEYSWIRDQSKDNKIETLNHNDVSKKNWHLDCSQKESKEVRTISAEAGLTIKWKRHGSNRINELISSPVQLTLPLYEPRVIVDMERTEVSGAEVIRLKYYVENATSHILTYTISNSGSSSFVFQGVKKMNLRMLPFTRKCLEYILIPLSAGKSILPQLKVHDTYYKRTLVIISANKEIRQDRNELYIIV